MKDKRSFKFHIPEINAYIIFTGLLIFCVSIYNYYLGIAFFLIYIYSIYQSRKITHKKQLEWAKYLENLCIDMDYTTKMAILNLPIPLCILQFDGSISWYNSKFASMVEDQEILHEDIQNVIPDLNIRKVLNENKELYTKVKFKNRNYSVVYKVIKSQCEDGVKYLIMVYWIDQTDYIDLAKKFDDEICVPMLIQIDAYDEVLESATEEYRPIISAKTEKTLNNWAKKLNGAFRKNAVDKYCLWIKNKELVKLEKEKFKVLDELREIDFGNTLPVTASIGIGAYGETLEERLKNAMGGLDLALGRGGDQAVVKRKDKSIFYGGKSKAVEKKTKVRSRLIAYALKDLMLDSENILIMGHKYPDLDALGSALGICNICKFLGKNANIILNSSNSSIDILVDRLKSSEDYDNIFINREDAIKLCTKNTLVIVVDTHRANFTECEQILEISEKLVVIDHHRKGVDYIKNYVLTYHETYASSTSELVTELLQYIDEKIVIDKLSAEALLSGIMLDTKNFTFKTGVRTFEAASVLRKIGADTMSVKQLFQGDYDNFVAKAEIIKNAKIIANKIAISVCPNNIMDIQLVSAQGADELLNVKGVKASFVLGKNKDDIIFISARSLGDINVQVIMETLGGGGHLDTAGAQIKDVSIEEAIDTVEELIMEYLKEG